VSSSLVVLPVVVISFPFSLPMVLHAFVLRSVVIVFPIFSFCPPSLTLALLQSAPSSLPCAHNFFCAAPNPTSAFHLHCSDLRATLSFRFTFDLLCPFFISAPTRTPHMFTSFPSDSIYFFSILCSPTPPPPRGAPDTVYGIFISSMSRS